VPRLTPAEVVSLWCRVSDLSPRFALGSAYHETRYNPGENDVGDQPNQADSTSYGLYQLNRTEQASALVWGDLNDPEVNTKVFASISAARLASLETAAAAKGGWTSDGDRWAYLAMAHNMGLGSALKTIARYGGNWSAYKARNPSLPFVAKGYGDDVITGGPDWSDSYLPLDGSGPMVGAGTETLIKYALIACGAWLAWRLYKGQAAVPGGIV